MTDGDYSLPLAAKQSSNFEYLGVNIVLYYNVDQQFYTIYVKHQLLQPYRFIRMKLCF